MSDKMRSLPRNLREIKHKQVKKFRTENNKFLISLKLKYPLPMS